MAQVPGVGIFFSPCPLSLALCPAGIETRRKVSTIVRQLFWFCCIRSGAGPRTPGIFLGMTRVFKEVFCCTVSLSGETEAGPAGTQPVEG